VGKIKCYIQVINNLVTSKNILKNLQNFGKKRYVLVNMKEAPKTGQGEKYGKEKQKTCQAGCLPDYYNRRIQI